MTDPRTLQQQLDKLKGARALGTKRVRYNDGSEHEFRSDADIVRAIAALEREIATLEGTAKPTVLNVVSTKGW